MDGLALAKLRTRRFEFSLEFEVRCLREKRQRLRPAFVGIRGPLDDFPFEPGQRFLNLRVRRESETFGKAFPRRVEIAAAFKLRPRTEEPVGAKLFLFFRPDAVPDDRLQPVDGLQRRGVRLERLAREILVERVLDLSGLFQLRRLRKHLRGFRLPVAAFGEQQLHSPDGVFRFLVLPCQAALPVLRQSFLRMIRQFEIVSLLEETIGAVLFVRLDPDSFLNDPRETTERLFGLRFRPEREARLIRRQGLLETPASLELGAFPHERRGPGLLLLVGRKSRVDRGVQPGGRFVHRLVLNVPQALLEQIERFLEFAVLFERLRLRFQLVGFRLLLVPLPDERLDAGGRLARLGNGRGFQALPQLCERVVELPGRFIGKGVPKQPGRRRLHFLQVRPAFRRLREKFLRLRVLPEANALAELFDGFAGHIPGKKRPSLFPQPSGGLEVLPSLGHREKLALRFLRFGIQPQRLFDTRDGAVKVAPFPERTGLVDLRKRISYGGRPGVRRRDLLVQRVQPRKRIELNLEVHGSRKRRQIHRASGTGRHGRIRGHKIRKDRFLHRTRRERRRKHRESRRHRQKQVRLLRHRRSSLRIAWGLETRTCFRDTSHVYYTHSKAGKVKKERADRAGPLPRSVQFRPVFATIQFQAMPHRPATQS